MILEKKNILEDPKEIELNLLEISGWCLPEVNVLHVLFKLCIIIINFMFHIKNS